MMNDYPAVTLTEEEKERVPAGDIWLGPGPGAPEIRDCALKPEGMPETWSTLDIRSSYGNFDEDTFPPALDGESVDEYCRRVPNVWSPDSLPTDVVDVTVACDMVWALDVCFQHHVHLEKPLMKIPPDTPDWHVTYQIDYELMLQELLERNRPFPIFVSEEKFAELLEEYKAGIADKGIDYHFKARTVHEFWVELTGKSLEDHGIPTWEKELDRRIAEAKKEKGIAA